MGTDKRNRKKENRRQRLDDLAKQQHRRRTRKRITRLVIVIASVVGVTFIIWVSRGDDAVTSTDTTPSTQASQTA
ncbi:MAG: hypothetical protein O3A24_04735, partial [Actinobacteria bacterium]|nr:hypothetical protein [Actinomycetota bacterium]